MIKVIGYNEVKRDTVHAGFATIENAMQFAEWLRSEGYTDAAVYVG